MSRSSDPPVRKATVAAGRTTVHDPVVARSPLERFHLAHYALAPYLIYLMCRHRSLTLFTAANPGISSGGAVGESKSESLRHLRSLQCAVADFLLVDPREDREAARRSIENWRRAFRIQFPIIAKPEVGERGWGVEKLPTPGALDRYLADATKPLLLQRHIRGREYGIFYVRHPEESSGRILSIAEVQYPDSSGDRDRYRCARRVYSDCRALRTAALERRIDRIAKTHPGFHVGRFDVIAPSADALRDGELTVIEVNGVLAEPVHVYGRTVGLADRIRSMAGVWRDAFAIAAHNVGRGAKPMGAGALARRLLVRFLDQSDAMTALRAAVDRRR